MTPARCLHRIPDFLIDGKTFEVGGRKRRDSSEGEGAGGVCLSASVSVCGPPHPTEKPRAESTAVRAVSAMLMMTLHLFLVSCVMILFAFLRGYTLSLCGGAVFQPGG